MINFDYEKYIQKYCCEDISKIENYERAKANNFKGWNCHHRLETHNSDGEKRLVDLLAEELIALDMYYNRPADELIFLTRSEHTIIHHKDKCRSTETKKKLSDSHKGKSTWNKGNKLSEEHKNKISESLKGIKLSEEHKKKLSESKKGEKHPLYGKHHSEETKKKMSKYRKGKHWKLVDGKRVWY